MDPERWKRIDSLLQDALARPPEEREAFLQSACQGAEDLRREVESLLKSEQMAGGFLQAPAIEIEARALAVDGDASWVVPTPPEEAAPPGRCHVCSFPIPEGARFCGGCAIPISAQPRRHRRPYRASSSSTPSPDEGELAPGAVLDGRYTVLGLVGRGGMGEVYRARDNKLDQVVALKLLAGPLRGNTRALIGLHNEVRLSRRVSHPNVCRVHDIGESDGLHFLTMEFIDGSDLARLLKRVGRFPQDKAIEIARQICAALSAAHERGVLHRDLKPGNVMLNAAGQVVVTDFGLAALAEEMKAVESRSGTPTYMAPEQLAGGTVSVRSDIYGLGLVLYELFTGHRAFETENRAALPDPSSLVKDLSPDVESVIMRCLAAAPEQRPGSALAVAASLPGGDPLQLALAAGQTPPPEMVAASGAKAGITVRSAVWCLAAALAGLAGVLMFGSRPQVLARTPVEIPPEELALKSRELATSAGYPGQRRGRGSGFLYDVAQIRCLEREGWSQPALSRPSPVRFWYRESPQALASEELKGLSWNDPPQDLPGMISIQMDGAGHLTVFRALPDGARPRATTGPNWNALFAAAGLDSNSMRATEPQIVPPVYADSRFAWTASYADQPRARVRVEAAALAGRPVYFRLTPSWELNTPEPAQLDVAFQITARPYPPSYTGPVLAAFFILTLFAGWVAWRNARTSRGDRRGALRVAALVFLLWTIYGVAIGFGQFEGVPERSWLVAANALFWAGQAWIFYMALEPWVRRSWPHSLISWSRLLYGSWRDPLVGRDTLIGILVASWFFLLRAQLPIVIGSAVPASLRAFIGIFPVSLAASASGALVAAVAFTLTLLVSRRIWAAYLLTSAFLFVMNFFLVPGRDWIQVAAAGTYGLIMAAVLARFGVLALYTAMATSYLLFAMPLGSDFNAWYQNDGRICVLLLAGLAVYGFRSALAGRRVLNERLA